MDVEPAAPRDEPPSDPAVRIEGVVLRRVQPFVDHRGTLTEVMSDTTDFWDEPVVYAYHVTVAPGRIKGWGMHKLQADRYYVFGGTLRVVLHDGRVDSPTRGAFAQLFFSPEAPGLLKIPPGVWHADQNLGAEPASLINFPTRPFDRARPDKYRLDPASDAIPFDFTLRDA